MEKFNKMLAERMKDKKSGMSDTEKDAKMSVLQHVRDMAQDMMKDKLQGGLKKVEVASDSPKGLSEGLDKAKEMVEGSPEEEASESPEHEAMEQEEGDEDESPEAEGSEEGSEDDDMGHMSEEEIDQKLQKLMAMKKMMGSKKA